MTTYRPGTRVRFDYGPGNPNNRLCHIRAVVDDDYIVLRLWSPRRGWLYFVESRDYLDLTIEKGHARIEAAR